MRRVKTCLNCHTCRSSFASLVAAMPRQFDFESWSTWRAQWKHLWHPFALSMTYRSCAQKRLTDWPLPIASEWPQMDKHCLEWLRFCSWGCCRDCGRMYTRIITQAEVRDPERARCKLDQICWNCAHGKNHYYVPQAADYPEELLHLDSEVVFALRPFVLGQGDPRKHRSGYVRKDKPTKVSWDKLTVKQKLRNLPFSQQLIGERAFKWLLGNNDAYKAMVGEHTKAVRVVTGFQLGF